MKTSPLLRPVSVKRTLLAGCACVALVVSGCANSSTSQSRAVGTFFGAVAGAAIGAQFGKGNGKLAATALGVLAGGFLGNQIGAWLDEKDQAEIAHATTSSIDQAQDGQTIIWENPESGAKADITPVETKQVKSAVTIARPPEIAAPPALIVLGKTYIATTSANVRAAPDISAKIVSGLRAQQRFQAIGLVQGTHWIMVARNNRTIGYVHESLVEEAPPHYAKVIYADPDTAPPIPAGDNMDSPPPVTDQQPELRKKNTAAGFDLDDPNLVVDDIPAEQTCRVMDVHVEKGDQAQADRFTACKSADGAWEII